MSDKKFTPQEVAVAVLKKSQEMVAQHKEKKAEICKEELDKCGEMKVVGKAEDKKEYSRAVGDVDPKIIDDTKAKLKESKEKKDKKLPEFLKKKFMKKSMGSAPVAPEAAKGTASQSPQSPSIGSQIGWPNSGKSEK